MTKDKCIYFSRFQSNINGHGGDRRFIQIKEILEKIDCHFLTPEDIRDIDRSFLSKFINISMTKLKIEGLKKYLLTHGEYYYWSKNHRDYVYSLNLLASTWSKVLEKNIKKLIIVDDPIYFSPLVKNLKNNKNIKIIGVCHNIESLSEGQTALNKQVKLFLKEIKVLSLCDLVITISREEHFLLNNLNIKSYHLPYYPIDIIKEGLLKIRTARKNTIKKDLLLLGTALNHPTRLGMEKVISSWVKLHPDENDIKLLVAGYGTEQLSIPGNCSNIELLGPVSNHQLEYLLSTVIACLCYQEKASGALTRIMEMLIAGIPVIANTMACRSYYDLSGVIEIKNLDEVDDALKKAILLDRTLPIPSSPDDHQLLEKINELNPLLAKGN
jgi:glycosyltransferase involved in cell wall biosynthesis